MPAWKAGFAFKSMSKAFGTVGRTGVGLTTAGGAAAGGIYGAFSDDTSVIGGALGGAMLGAGAWGASRVGSHGLGRYGANRAAGLSRGKALSKAFDDMSFNSKMFFGAKVRSNKAVNPINSGNKTVAQGEQYGPWQQYGPVQPGAAQSANFGSVAPGNTRIDQRAKKALFGIGQAEAIAAERAAMPGGGGSTFSKIGAVDRVRRAIRGNLQSY